MERCSKIEKTCRANSHLLLKIALYLIQVKTLGKQFFTFEIYIHGRGAGGTNS
jgi:hypothetical protein